MPLYFSDKHKGETLLEVVISLTILATVLGATINLAARSLNLSVTSRDDTEAVAMAQKGLANGVVFMSKSCNSGSVPDTTTVYSEAKSEANGQKELAVTKETLAPDEENAALGLTSARFYKIVAEVTWTDRYLGDRRFMMQQIMKR